MYILFYSSARCAAILGRHFHRIVVVFVCAIIAAVIANRRAPSKLIASAVDSFIGGAENWI